MRILTGFCVAALYIVAESWPERPRHQRDARPGAGDLHDRHHAGQWRRANTCCRCLTRPDSSSSSWSPCCCRSRWCRCCFRPARRPTSTHRARSPCAASTKPRRWRWSAPPCSASPRAWSLGMSAVYATSAGLEGAAISIFVSAFMIGGVVMQFPIGRLSDRFDRRLVITVVTLGAGRRGAAGLACERPQPLAAVRPDGAVRRPLPVDVRPRAEPCQRPPGGATRWWAPPPPSTWSTPPAASSARRPPA